MSYFKPDLNLFQQIFELVTQQVHASGGDGDGAVICKYWNYEDVADYFELKLNTENSGFKRSVLTMGDVSCITFTRGNNENLRICNYEFYSFTPDFFELDDIVVIF